MPNRIIKESIHTSETVNAMTDFQFRLWVNLIAYVDDYGRGDARPAVIKGACFPLRERLTVKDIAEALRGLADIGCVVLYEVDGRPYLCFPTWDKHQAVRNKRSKFPEPDLQAIECNCNQLQANVSVIQSNPNPNPNPNPRESVRFAPPTREEAEAYCKEKGYTLNLDTWFAYYEQNGWMVGRGKMKDWKASLAYWQSKEKPGKAPAMTMASMDYGDSSKRIADARAALNALTKKGDAK